MASDCTSPDFCPSYPPEKRCRGCLLKQVTNQRDELLARIDSMQAEIDAERALRMLAIRQRDEAEDEAAAIVQAEDRR